MARPDRLPLRCLAPLTRGGHVSAALNLFFRDPRGNAVLDAPSLTRVADSVARWLSDSLGPDLVVGPGTGAERRRRIWLAVGMGMVRWSLTGPDALDRLRAHAYSGGTTLDDLASELVEGRVTFDEL